MPLRWWSGLNSAVLTQLHISQHCMCRQLQNCMCRWKNVTKLQQEQVPVQDLICKAILQNCIIMINHMFTSKESEENQRVDYIHPRIYMQTPTIIIILSWL